MAEIMQLVSQVGFPIVCVFLLFWWQKYTYDHTNEVTKNSIDKIGNLAEAVNNNTVVLTHLVEKLESSPVDDGK